MDSGYLLPVFGSGPDTSQISQQVVSRHLTGKWNVALCWRKYTAICASVIWPLGQHLLTQATALLFTMLNAVGGLCDTASAISRGNLINDILIDTRVQLTAGKLRSAAWIVPETTRGGLRYT